MFAYGFTVCLVYITLTLRRKQCRVLVVIDWRVTLQVTCVSRCAVGVATGCVFTLPVQVSRW